MPELPHLIYQVLRQVGWGMLAWVLLLMLVEGGVEAQLVHINALLLLSLLHPTGQQDLL